MGCLPLGAAPRELVEGESRIRMDGRLAGVFHPATNGEIDVSWVEFHGPRGTAGLLCGDQRCAASEEAVEDEAAALRTVFERIRD